MQDAKYYVSGERIRQRIQYIILYNEFDVESVRI